ncbi:DNA internalization-related competence protein ComEC/Rec2 [Colwellia piezophila]|uniref:DNA internalization-related competence protein ComEC/Rec2 n=1 Tax=Colwellia piezophila TaxID=211668 RepID=UPI0003674273|nr:DNA internalization-related competence protein ComEC/Rec2 [Colwellia piezophila]
MDWWLLTFFLGAILSLFLPEVPAIFQLFLLLFLATGFYCHKNLRLSSGIGFGALWLLTHAYLYHNQLPHQFVEQMQNKQSFVVEGQVLSLQVKESDSFTENHAIKSVTKRFNLRVSQVNKVQLSTPIIIRLSWKNANLDVSQGQILALKVKLKPAHGLANVGGFNYLTWLKANNISATGYVINQKKKNKHKNQGQYSSEGEFLNPAEPAQENKLLAPERTIRQVLFSQYQRLLPEHQLTPILLALAFGERSLLTPEHWQVLQATGTSHLIAISGLHVGLLAGSAFFIVMLIVQHLPLQSDRWQPLNIRYVAIVVSLLMATLYAYLAGFSLPTQRALVMLNLYWFTRLLSIKMSPKRLILVTLFILLLLSPFSLFTASFWLSFYAVAIIFVSLWRFQYWLTKGPAFWRFIKGLFIIQIALTVMLMPISAIFFQQISLVSLFANIIAVPWMSMVSIPSALLSVLVMPLSETLAHWLAVISLTSLAWLWHYLLILADLPFAVMPLSWRQQLILLIVGALAFTLLYLSPFHWARRGKHVAFLLVVAALIFSAGEWPHSKDDERKTSVIQHYATPWQVLFFDVGQGLSVLIRRNNQAILYDTGAAYPSGFTLSEAVILPYLQYSAIAKLDKVILSHSDNDHAGGIESLLKNIKIDEIVSNDGAIALLGLNNTKITSCQPSQSFSWQGLTFAILWPIAHSLSAEKYSAEKYLAKKNSANKYSSDKYSSEKPKRGKQKNDDSCVILITDAMGKTVLLTGDISSKVERQLLALYPNLRTDILQVPHHGSKTSSSQIFLQQLSPKLAVVSAGYLNRWYMPVAKVRQRYLDSEIILLNNAQVGQVIITFDKNDISAQTYVDELRPFWFSHSRY